MCNWSFMFSPFDSLLPVLSEVDSVRLQLRRASSGGLSGRLASACQKNPIFKAGSTPAAHHAEPQGPIRDDSGDESLTLHERHLDLPRDGE
jgi:hypothetical protein